MHAAEPQAEQPPDGAHKATEGTSGSHRRQACVDRVELGHARRRYAAAHPNPFADPGDYAAAAVENLQDPVAVSEIVVRLPDHQVAAGALFLPHAQAALLEDQRPDEQGGGSRAAAHAQLGHRHSGDRRDGEGRLSADRLVHSDDGDVVGEREPRLRHALLEQGPVGDVQLHRS